MTRAQFVAKAVRNAEKNLHVPPGWWGKYRDVQGPEGQRVRYSTYIHGWILTLKGKVISRHGSRVVAIRKARGLR